MNNLSLSCECEQVVFGSILGDGSIRLDEKYKNARFSVKHSVKYHEYIFWKINYLHEIAPKKDFVNQNLLQDLTISFQSSACELVTGIFNLVAKHKKVEVRRKWLNKLTPLGLCIWWLDDGSLITNNKGILCTESYSYDEHLLIVRYFRKVWKIDLKIIKRNLGYRLLFNTTELKKLLMIVLPYIPVRCMLYKGILLYKDSEMQERWISEVERLSCFKRNEIEEIVFEKKQVLKRFSQGKMISENDIVHTHSNMGRI